MQGLLSVIKTDLQLDRTAAAANTGMKKHSAVTIQLCVLLCPSADLLSWLAKTTQRPKAVKRQHERQAREKP